MKHIVPLLSYIIQQKTVDVAEVQTAEVDLEISHWSVAQLHRFCELNHIPTVEMLSLTPLYLQLVNNLHIKGYQHDSDEWMDIGKYKEYSNILS